MLIKLLCLVVLLHGALAASHCPSVGTWSVKTLTERFEKHELRHCTMGIMTGDIPDSAMTASSSYDHNHGAERGRLFIQREGDLRAGWSAEENYFGQWIQVDLGESKQVSGILTQGRGDEPLWVETYEVSYGTTESNLKFFKENGVTKIFTGNTNMQSVVRNIFSTNLYCRYFRIYPKTWNTHISLRFDLLNAGCRTLHEDNLELICGMGLESGAISDSALSASSELDINHGPQRGRLDITRMVNPRGAWTALTNNVNEWIQVDLGATKFVAGIITQGRSDLPQWVKKYTVSCGRKKHNLKPISEDPLIAVPKEFPGNSDMQTKVINQFPEVMACRYVRVYPVTWNVHISMRFELIDGACYDLYWP